MQRSWHMLPRPSLDDKKNGAFANAEQPSDHVERHDPRSIHCPYFNNLSLAQLGRSRLRSSSSIKSAFNHAITHIFCVSSKPQMRRIAATPIIAFVTALKTFGNWSIGIFPRQPVSRYRFRSPSIFIPAFWIRSKFSVSMMRFFSKPWPAIVRSAFLDLSPESFLGWGFGHHACGELNI